ncbi:MAG TPA: GYF domain-containing protein [Polyangiaceae bacterium]|nr:GYF domain-containing protein [Polyangiaceae bacterium]
MSGSERDLRAALSGGSVPANALVWRPGWAEWLPANRVAELNDAIPEASRESTLKPRRDPNMHNPPTAPGERTPVSAATAPLAPKTSAPVPRVSPPAQRTQPPPPPIRAKASAPPAPGNASVSNAPASGGLPPLAPTIPGQRRELKPSSPNPSEAARDTLAPSSFGTIGAPRRAAPAATVVRRDAVTPVARGRSPLPTLTEEGTVPSATATLRPPGAVPPPARGVPAVPALDSSSSFSFEKRSAVVTPIPSLGPPGGGFGAVLPAGLAPRIAPATTTPLSATPAPVLTPSINEPARSANALPPVVNKALLQAEAQAPNSQAPPSIEPPLDSTLEVMPTVPPEARRTPVEPLLAARAPLNSASEDVLARALSRHSLVKIGRFAVDSRSVVMALSALCGALLVALVAVFLTQNHANYVAPAPSASALASTPPTPLPAPGCRVTVPAALIAANVERSVPPLATPITAGSEKALALGFAATKTKGVGLRLNPDTLDTAPAFEEDGKDAVRGVVPLTRSGSLAFFVDRDDSALHSAHTVDEVPPFTLGVSDVGFSRVVAGSSSVIWPLDPDAKITEPRSAAVGAFGYGVTFRRGGQSGAVLLGFVGSDGAKKSELAPIPGAPKLLGTPVIAGSAAGALVAFAGRNTPDAPWQVFVSLVKPGAAPSPARELVSGIGGGAISPTLSALAPDRWLVQWTEGISGQYQVRVQSFSADLTPLENPALVSPKGANAGQGSLATFAGGATTLFILTTAGHDELWGATLSCQ